MGFRRTRTYPQRGPPHLPPLLHRLGRRTKLPDGVEAEAPRLGRAVGLVDRPPAPLSAGPSRRTDFRATFGPTSRALDPGESEGGLSLGIVDAGRLNPWTMIPPFYGVEDSPGAPAWRGQKPILVPSRSRMSWLLWPLYTTEGFGPWMVVPAVGRRNAPRFPGSKSVRSDLRCRAAFVAPTSWATPPRWRRRSVRRWARLRSPR